jgi:hypothetical protein
MAKHENKHGPGCNFCVHEEIRIIQVGSCGYINHRGCSNKKPCNGYEINPPEYKSREISCTYRGGLKGAANGW